MTGFQVTRLLQNPLGQVAPPGHRGDIVRVSDGLSTIYLEPAEFESTSRERLWDLLDHAARRTAR